MIGCRRKTNDRRIVVDVVDVDGDRDAGRHVRESVVAGGDRELPDGPLLAVQRSTDADRAARTVDDERRSTARLNTDTTAARH